MAISVSTKLHVTLWENLKANHEAVELEFMLLYYMNACGLFTHIYMFRWPAVS